MNQALVTGSAGLLGQAVAVELSKSFSQLALHFNKSKPDLNLLSNGCKAELFQQDFSVADIDESNSNLISAIKKASGADIDVAVLNASSQHLTQWKEQSTADWDSMYQSSLRPTASLLHKLGEHMRQSRNSNPKVIVVVGSIEGIRPAVNHAPYAVMKAALHHLVTAAAYELGQSNIRVVGVAPGLIARLGLEADWPSGVSSWNQTAALGRMVTAEEVAQAIAFLCSPNSSAITGVTIPVDAGWGSHPGW
jgi:3-oxoacyl-[acyl-carrier protein] reductase